MLWLLLGSRRTGTESIVAWPSSRRAPVAVAAATSPLRAVLTTEWQLDESSEAGVSVQRLYDLIQPPDEDAFFDEIDALEEEGWLTIRNGSGDDDDLLFPAAEDGSLPAPEAAGRAAAATAASIFAGTAEQARLAAEAAAATAAAAVTAAAGESARLPAVPFDLERHGEYDYAAEAAAVEAVVAVLTRLKCAGMDAADEKQLPALDAACARLEQVTALSPAPSLREDPRLEGAWEQVGCTSADFNTRKGLTGLGGAPFTSPAALFYCYDGGAVRAKEVLRLFGRPVLLNELRGEYGFSPDGALMQERFGDADLGGQRSSKEFSGATATTRHVCITADGAVRVAKVDAAAGVGAGGYLVYKRLAAGEMEAWLESKRLPLIGGTVPTLSMEEMREAYPYLGEGEGAGGDGFAGIKLPWS